MSEGALPESVTVLENDRAKYYLVGTAHVSKASVSEVNSIIEEVRPDVVCVELCEARYKALVEESAWKNLDLFEVIRKGKTLFLLANLAIGAYQRRIGQSLGVKPGAELLAAVKKAEEVGAAVELIDRDIHVTLKRTWHNLGFFKKLMLLSAIIEGLVGGEEIKAEDIEKLKQEVNLSEMLTMFAEELPEVKVPLIDERDAYLMSGIEAVEGKKVVAVVGAAHVPGMKELFGKSVDREALAQLPAPSRVLGALKWLVPVAVLGAFAFGYYKNEGQSLEAMLWAWVLPNSVFAGLFTLVAAARPASVLTAIIASPITSLNPMLGAGMVVGLLEAWLRKPTVADFENINDDVQSLRGIYRNPVTRVLLVAVCATLGSALGGWVGLGWLVSVVA